MRHLDRIDRKQLGLRSTALLLLTTALVLCSCAEAVRERDGDGSVLGGDSKAGSGADSGAAQTVPSSFHEFCGRVARDWCKGHMGCCKDPGEHYATAAECEKGFARECRLYFSDPVFGSCVPYNKPSAAAYLTKMNKLTSSCGVDKLDYLSLTFSGTTPPGGDCSYTRTNGFPQFHCCQPGTRCVAKSVEGDKVKATCEGGLKQLGQSCYTNDCAGGLYCSYPKADAVDKQRYCAPQRPAGSPCTYSSECSSSVCKQGQCALLDKQELYCGRAKECLLMSWIRTDSLCGITWRCADKQRLELDCKMEGGVWRCICERNAVQERVFSSSSICSLSGDTLAAAIRTGCGWQQLTW